MWDQAPRMMRLGMRLFIREIEEAYVLSQFGLPEASRDWLLHLQLPV